VNSTYALIFVGLVFIIAALVTYIRIKKIKKYGVEADGIVFSADRSSANYNFGNPVIRFVAQDEEWITASSKVGVPWPYRNGEKVKVFYLPDEPTEFIIYSKKNGKILLVMLIVGFIFLLVGVFKLLEIQF
jgi:hypothetical protein